MSKTNRLVLIDGNAIIHRAYHAYPKTLTTTKGELINAVYGFTSILLTVFKELKPEYVAVSFDLKAPTFRHKKFKGYKASRPKMDEELAGQIDRVKQMVKILNIPIFEKEGFEADDVIGTLALQAKIPKQKAKSKKLETIIVTGDRDALQLIDNQVKVYLPARGKMPAEIVGRKQFIKKYGFEPLKLIDFKALAGDASDEIPGVLGIGPKTASDLIVRFKDLKGIYKNLSEIKEQVRQKLIRDKNNAFLSLELAEIVTKVPIKLDLAKCELKDYDKDKAIELFEEFEFRSLIRKLPNNNYEQMVEDAMNGKKKEEDKSKQMELF